MSFTSVSSVLYILSGPKCPRRLTTFLRARVHRDLGSLCVVGGDQDLSANSKGHGTVRGRKDQGRTDTSSAVKI